MKKQNISQQSIIAKITKLSMTKTESGLFKKAEIYFHFSNLSFIICSC